MKRLLINKALTKQQRHLIWDALHTHINDQNTKGILLKSELKSFKEIEPLFKPKGK